MKKTDAFSSVVKPVCRPLFHVLAAAMAGGRLLALAAAVALPCLSSRAAATPGITAVHTFSALQGVYPSPLVNSDGASPGARMTLGSDGNLYGTTLYGGINGAGIIFRLSPSNSLADLFDFQPTLDTDGQEFYDLCPNELTPGPKGLFYGTTQRGGTNKNGTIFVFSPTRGEEQDLYVFSAEGTNVSGSNPDGMNPTGALVPGTNGSFYGTTQYGGSNGNGTIFQLTPAAPGFACAYSFSPLGGADLTTNADGATPNGLALGSDGNFYGTTQVGGANGAGTFFQFTISGALTPLYSFGATHSDAATPQGALVQGQDGNFYGVSEFGGAFGSGTIFKITLSGVENVLYSFTGTNDGGVPTTGLTLGSDGSLASDGHFYGTTSGAGPNETGVLYEISSAGVFTNLYSFAALNTNSENKVGANPSATLAVGRDGNLYGSCQYGGMHGTGTIFRYANANFVSPTLPPVITTRLPAKLSALAGTYLTLNAAAKGMPPLRAQWMKNKTNVLSDGGDISGSLTGALVLGPLHAADAGSYSVVVTNNSGGTTSAVVILTVTPDTTPPSVAIVSPAANARTNSPLFSGTASDNVRVTNVVWWLTNKNGGLLLSNNAPLTRGGSNWSFTATPFPGTNVLAVQSVDWSGNKSKFASRTFFYKVTSALGLQTGGDGTGSFSHEAASVKNDTVPANGALLNIGEGYSIQAVAGGNSLFSNWVSTWDLGALANPAINTNAVLTFVMQSNMVLTANFVSNFFLPARGTYNGLFFNPTNVAAESSGMLKGLLLATNGTFSAQLLKSGTAYPLAGRFDVSGRYSNSLGKASAPGGLLKVHLEVDRAAGQIVGTVSNTQWSAGLKAEMAGTHLPSAEYTLLLAPSSNAPANSPPGDGYALVTNLMGMVAFSGRLADGTAITPAAAASQNWDVPVYSGSLYGNAGLLLGWINLTNLDAAAPSNTLAWIKPASRSYPPYTNGFTNTLQLQGGLWTNPPVKAPAIALTNGLLVISNASLNLPFHIAVSNNDALVKLAASPTNAMTNSMTGSIAPKTGLLTVTFGNGNGKATTQGFGAILQTQTNGGGYFLGATNAGSISLLPAP